MPHLTAFVLTLSLLLLTACNEKDSSSEQSANIPADQIAATVNGAVISKAEVNHFKEN